MKVKTSELSGKALKFAMIRAKGYRLTIPIPTDMQEVEHFRRVVSAKLGDEVEIPDELMEVKG